MVTLGKAFPYPQPMRVWCFALAHALAVGRRVWSQQGLQDEQPPAVAVFRVLLPPRPGHRFSRSLGPLARVLAHGGLRQQGRAGQRVGQKS